MAHRVVSVTDGPAFTGTDFNSQGIHMTYSFDVKWVDLITGNRLPGCSCSVTVQMDHIDDNTSSNSLDVQCPCVDGFVLPGGSNKDSPTLGLHDTVHRVG